MNYHILIILIILLIFYLINNKTIEGNTNDIRLMVNSSTRLMEVIQGVKNEINAIFEIPKEDVDEILKETILKAEYLANYNNERNNSLVNNSGNYNNEILEMLNEFSKEVDEEIISNYDGNKEELRDALEQKIQNDIENYGNRIEIITKKYMDKKYQELKNDYETLLESNRCEDQIESMKKEEENTCNVKINEKDDIITKKENEIKKMSKTIAQNYVIRQKVKTLEGEIKRLKNRGRRIIRTYCGGKKKGRHPRHCGGRTIKSKRECESTYKKYRGRDHHCQWVNSRRSCDFWQPGRPHTKKYC
tara:strand:- start:6672 stop:7583 length:912 start_codon:yes stop_codon:yes gene_type:complete